MSTPSESLSCDINEKSCCCSTEEATPNNDLISHWDTTYEKARIEKLGWYEKSPDPSLLLLKKCQLDKTAHILNVGAGATTFVDVLKQLGYTNITANDLSVKALDHLKTRLGKTSSKKIQWVVDDLTNPSILEKLAPVDLWHDRAVFHFFTEVKDQESYLNLLSKLVKSKGFVIIATFNLEGATTCSGLPVKRYNQKMLQEQLGDSFTLVDFFDYTYIMPSGASREYVYTLFQRI